MTSEALRTRVSTIFLCSGMVGIGIGLGVMWAAIVTVQAAPMPQPDWLLSVSADYRGILYIGTAVLAVGMLGHLIIELDPFGWWDSGRQPSGSDAENTTPEPATTEDR